MLCFGMFRLAQTRRNIYFFTPAPVPPGGIAGLAPEMYRSEGAKPLPSQPQWSKRATMNTVKRNIPGVLLCMAIAAPAWLAGRYCPLVGGPVFAILGGMCVALLLGGATVLQPGIAFTSKKILQYAVILLGFGLNLSVVLDTGLQSLPIIVTTIAVALGIAYALHKLLRIQAKTATLVGVGSAICGGSAIAATAPVINADNQEVAQAVSVIFFFNVLAAVLFPALGGALGFSPVSGEAFGVFAGTAINDTSSVTAAAATWDSLHNLGSATLDKAVVVKLTRTLAIIPIVLALALFRARAEGKDGAGVSLRTVFPFFIVWFVLASAITTLASGTDVFVPFFAACKTASKVFIVMAMAAIGLNTNPVKLVKTGGKPLVMGFCCWVGIAVVSLAMQHVMGIW